MPDLVALMFVTLSTGLRLSVRVAVIGSACNLLSFGILNTTDYIVSGPRPLYSEDLGLAAILMVSFTVIAIVMAGRTRRLVEKSAMAAAKSERARQSLDVILKDQHDVRTLLSSASLSAALLARQINRTPLSREVNDIATRLNEDLAHVNDFVQESRQRAYGQKVAIDEPAQVDATAILRTVLPILQRRFPDVLFEVNISDNVTLWLAGGDSSLQRILLNLLVNACEGDGHRRATKVWVYIQQIDDRKDALVIADNGPGFAAEVLNQPLSQCPTSKDKGSGLGLYLVAGIAQASGGKVDRGTGDCGGARVTVELPRPS